MDAEIPQQTDSVKDPEVSPTVSTVDGGGVQALADDDAAAASSIELDSAITAEDDGGGDGGARVSESETPEKPDLVTCQRIEEGNIIETKPSSSDIKIEAADDSPELREDVSDDDESTELGSDADEKMLEVDSKEDLRGGSERHAVTDYKSLLSEFDEYVASEKSGSGVARALSYGFQVGDLVWGKVKSHPWWPGHIFNEAFASPSVRRMRRMDHVLVAFFGDSSYGWFDPAELIPFEPHLAEKSQQTVSKHFVRAVEEAMDEASRRSALGLTCKCRNPYNFRATNVQGYFAVDVPDYELQGVYSAEQIKNSRDKFSPLETLSFVKHLALAPKESASQEINFLKKKAVVNAFRKAMFEEFDETYGQAFGTKSIPTSGSTHEAHSKAKAPPRAPLSGPLVIAETLKSSKNPTKGKDLKKQEKYLLKQRDEAGDKSVQFDQVQASSSAGLGDSPSRNSLLQRKAPTLQTSTKDEQSGIVSMDITSSSAAIPSKECSSVSRPSLDEEKGSAEELKDKMEETTMVLLEHGKSEDMASRNQEVRTDPGSAGSSLQTPLKSPRGSHASASDERSSTEPVKKKVKVTKRSSGEMSSENPSSEPKKKKKKKIAPPNSEHTEKKKVLSSGEAGGAKKLSQLGSAHSYSYMEAADVPQILSHLQDLSLDPLSGSSVASFGTARKFFLRFRSLNYQKSLTVSSPDASAENAKDTKPLEPVKSVKRAGDPSKVGKKRLSSDLQDENPSAKKVKKTSQLKSVASEKKISREGKGGLKPAREQSSSAVQAKPAKAQTQTGKKPAPPVKVVAPTMLVMKFPPGTSLPSAALLKARFGRFGLLDQSAIRVFWKSSTCRVVFLYKADAQTAHRYAAGNSSLFGNVKVKYFLRDVDAPKAEPHEPENAKEDDERNNQSPPRHQPTLPPPNVNLKSCLKKPGDDRGTARVKFMLGGKEDSSKPTVEPPPFSSSSSKSTAPSASSSSSSSQHVAMEFVSKKFQNVVHHQPLPPSTLPPILPLPPQYSKPIKTVDHVEPPQRQQPSRNMLGPSQAVGSGDISHQMLHLLSKCNDVVANVTGLLGYVPYHRL